MLDNPEAMAAVELIKGWRSLGDHIIETIINQSDKVKALKAQAKEKGGALSKQEKKALSAEEKEYKSKRKLVQLKVFNR